MLGMTKNTKRRVAIHLSISWHLKFLNLIDKSLWKHQGNALRHALKIVLAGEISLNESLVFLLATWLHDIGKIHIDPEILKKPGPLSTEEYETMKQHVQLGALSKLLPFSMKSLIRIVIGQHHEKIDGTGYPHRLERSKIHPLALLLAVIDAFDAMTSWRVYNPSPKTADEAVAILARDSGTHFCPQATRIFVRTCFPELLFLYLSNERQKEPL
ncbi:HD domain-containing protein [Candidatus Saccharibacteria bacterium]|nr:HD domain-containing protein [Candidatus Saccharibacteria bacterium]